MIMSASQSRIPRFGPFLQSYLAELGWRPSLGLPKRKSTYIEGLSICSVIAVGKQML
jgi:hypothetical protein